MKTKIYFEILTSAMTILLKIFILSIPFNSFSPVRYACHKQTCSGFVTVDRRWDLVLSDNGSYVFSIRSINTKKLDKEKTEQYIGSWEVSGDTLRLNYNRLSASSFVFLKQKGKLIHLRQPVDIVTGYKMEIDYMIELK